MKEVVKDFWIDDLPNPIRRKNIPLDSVISFDGTLLILSLTIQKGLDKKFPISFHSLRGDSNLKIEDELIGSINIELDEIRKEVEKYCFISKDAKLQILKSKRRVY